MRTLTHSGPWLACGKDGMNLLWGLSEKVLIVLSLRLASGKGSCSGCLICEVTALTLVGQVGGEMSLCTE